MTDDSPVQPVEIRAAAVSDADAIHTLLMSFAREQLVLPRPKSDILERIRNFRVILAGGKLAGFSALRDYGNGLYEVRSLVVAREFQHAGLASMLVNSQIETVRAKGQPARIFALTYREHFFNRLGFVTVEKTLFPEKIWSDCEQCPKKNRCDETAVLMLVNQER